MQGYDAETAAKIIADNVVSAYARDRDGSGALNPGVRDIVVGKLVQALVRVLPSEDGAFLATVCNFTLVDALGGMDTGGPRVEAVDPDDGSVTMRGV